MFCPVDGDEFRQGITQCPEHDVALVEEPPDLDVAPRWTDRLDDQFGMMAAFLIFVAAAIVYAIFGATASIIIAVTRDDDPGLFEDALLFQDIANVAFPIAIAALGVLIAALLLRAYLNLTDPDGERRRNDDETVAVRGPIPGGLMRVLSWLTIVFALLWAGTGIATSEDRARYETASSTFGFGDEDEEEPDETFLDLLSLHYAAYAGGVGCLAIMGAGLIARTYRRMEPTPEPKRESA